MGKNALVELCTYLIDYEICVNCFCANIISVIYKLCDGLIVIFYAIKSPNYLSERKTSTHVGQKIYIQY